MDYDGLPLAFDFEKISISGNFFTLIGYFGEYELAFIKPIFKENAFWLLSEIKVNKKNIFNFQDFGFKDCRGQMFIYNGEPLVGFIKNKGNVLQEILFFSEIGHRKFFSFFDGENIIFSEEDQNLNFEKKINAKIAIKRDFGIDYAFTSEESRFLRLNTAETFKEESKKYYQGRRQKVLAGESLGA